MDDKREPDSFDQRLNEARGRHGLDKPLGSNGGNASERNLVGLAARASVELVSAFLVGGVIGYWLDRWLHTSPIFLLLFLFLGAAAGVVNLLRSISPRNAPSDD